MTDPGRPIDAARACQRLPARVGAAGRRARAALLALLAGALYGCIDEVRAETLPPAAGAAAAAPGAAPAAGAGPSASAAHSGAGHASSGAPPAVIPWGVVGRDGGTVQRLWFALTGDTRPGSCDDTAGYPTATIEQIARSMRSLHVQFGLDLGDHMFVCNDSLQDARTQMGNYMSALGQGPATFWMTMGNHECGHVRTRGGCFPGDGDPNMATYMAALGRPLPWYSTDVKTAQGLARFVFVADDSWCEEQLDWLEKTLADADANARYTIIARHHPFDGSRGGPKSIVATILKHKYTLLLTAHLHTYDHDPDALGGRSVIVGVGGGPSMVPPGFATVLQNKDGTLSFVMRDLDGNPVGDPWSVTPQ